MNCSSGSVHREKSVAAASSGRLCSFEGMSMEVPSEVPLAIIETQFTPPVLLIPACDAARMCGKTTRSWRAWDAAGWIPRPMRIGRSTLWRVAELQAWVEAGCPRRTAWESRPKKSSKPT